MILEGFEIENWSCIKRVAVDTLPSTGVIVLHGPNGTGKSSIVAALRACLMDFASSSAAQGLRRWFPKNNGDKPRVSVCFRVGEGSWRITKQFGSKDSRLEFRTESGSWKLEAATAADAHERTRQLIGDKDSNAGLQQLLWLTQAEFKLPSARDFDADVQSQLRAVLGVMQTPLDDHFLNRVKERWSSWFTARNKPGASARLKPNCPLDKALKTLEQLKTELAGIEEQYRSFERMLERSGNLEVQSRDLGRQLAEKTSARQALQEEYESSLKRLEAHRSAAERVAAAEKARADAQAQRRRRQDSEARISEAEKLAKAGHTEIEEVTRNLHAAQQRLSQLRGQVQNLRNAERDLRSRLDELVARRQLTSLKEQLKIAREVFHRAEHMGKELAELKRQALERPAPDDAALKKLAENRIKANRIRADLEAAAITLTLLPEAGAAPVRLSVDGNAAVQTDFPKDGTPSRHAVHRRAEIAIPGWGRAEIARGSDHRELDQLEDDLTQLDREFAQAVGPFGIAVGEASALDELRRLAAEKAVREPQLRSKQQELERLAPKGLEPLGQEVARTEKLLHAGESAAKSAATELPSGAAELDALSMRWKVEIEATQKSVNEIQDQIEEAEIAIDGAGAHPELAARTSKNRQTALGLRQQEARAKEKLAGLNARLVALRDELAGMPSAEQVESDIRNAEEALGKARGEFEAAKLTESEVTIRQRRDTAEDAIRAIQEELAKAQKEFDQIEGALRLSEGLHPKRAAAAARVEELSRVTERECLESEAIDRLYALFEECREKQLGTVMGPVHDRVLRWMRLLRISDYQAIRFNDQFLPETLLGGDGATELTLGEESTGTIEQIALMVRLALGSILSKPSEPVVAMLDDPLTHSDVVRMDRMRAVLKSAATGDASSTPPSGPLQVIVFTCHPEWFAIDGAKIVDLAKTDVLSRIC